MIEARRDVFFVKKFCCALLILAMLAGLSACDEGKITDDITLPPDPAPAGTEAIPQDGGEFTVSTTDELIAAVGSDRIIRLEEGVFALSSAESYGLDTGNTSCVWEETYDGYELVIQNVRNLTITGAGKESTTLSADPRYAQVLRFSSCDNLSLTGFTAGHTKEPGACIGGVLKLEGCADVSIQDVGLYGCGVTGICAEGCTGVSVADSDIYECSENGIRVYNCMGIHVADCRLFDLGRTQDGNAFEVFCVDSCSDVTVSGCSVYANLVDTLVSTIGVDNVTLKDNIFQSNEVRGSAFRTLGHVVTLDGNSFIDNKISRWFDNGCGALDAQGNALDEAVLGDISGEEPTDARATVTVKDADAFLAAIGPNTEIILDADVINLCTARTYGGASGTYYRWEDAYDGAGLIIQNADNLTIRGKDGKTAGHILSTEPRYADVLTFTDCDHLVLSGFTAGHTPEPGECSGGVLCFLDCDSVCVEDCGLFGCGILGVQADRCAEITLRGCEIYECSYGGIEMRDVTGLTVENCIFRDLGGNNMMLTDCSGVSVDGEAVDGSFYNGR